MNKIVKFFLTLAVISPLALLAAEEGATVEQQSESSRRQRGMDAFREVNEQLKTKYPKEYAEIEELEKTDRRAAFAKRRELAEKAGIQTPSFRSRSTSSRERMVEAPKTEDEQKAQDEWNEFEEKVKTKYPKEYAEIEKLKMTSPEDALKKLLELAQKGEIAVPVSPAPEMRKVLPRDVARLAVEKAEEIIKIRFPEEYEKLLELRKESPDEARELFRELVKKAGLNSEKLKNMVTRRPNTTYKVKMIPQADSENDNSQRRNNRSSGGWGGGEGGPPPHMRGD